MVLAVDVFYKGTSAKSVGTIFKWEDDEPKQILTEHIENIEKYESGMFYKRELPCIIKILQKVDLFYIDAIVIDGYVYVNNKKKLGLGGFLWNVLERKIPVIGVAKNKFYNNSETVEEIKRGKSNKPLCRLPLF
ncbi:MAG TPA: endonuclease V [Ferruginibacter sp.]|mgnify:CR=1 FL=1|nr:endonuclease V [Ferruginibacter sp.]HMP22060.1 endonuclease V [Ferruginibacter sp.]